MITQKLNKETVAEKKKRQAQLEKERKAYETNAAL